MFDSGDTFLESQGKAFECVLMDIRMPGRDGLETLTAYLAKASPRPVVMMSGHADISIAVKAMRIGAINFIEKPCQRHALLDAIAEALKRSHEITRSQAEQAEARERFESLTHRERQIGNFIVDGLLNKEIAHEIGISIRTVETHRAHLMSKLGVRTVAALISVWPEPN